MIKEGDFTPKQEIPEVEKGNHASYESLEELRDTVNSRRSDSLSSLKKFKTSKEYLNDKIKHLSSERLRHIKDLLSSNRLEEIPREELFSPETQILIKKSMIKDFYEGELDGAIYKNYFISAQEAALSGPEIEQAIKSCFVNAFIDGRDSVVLRLQEKFNFFTSELINDPEIQHMAKKKIIEHLSHNGDIEHVIKAKKIFNLPEDVFLQIVKEGAIKAFSNIGNIGMDYFLKIKETFNIPNSFLRSPELQDIVPKRLIKSLFYGGVEDAIKIKDTFKLSDEVFKLYLREGLIESISGEGINSTVKIVEAFGVPDGWVDDFEIKQALKKKLIKDANTYQEEKNALVLKKIFNIPDDFIEDLEIQQAAQERLIRGFSQHSDLEYLSDILDGYNISENWINNPEIQQLAQKYLVHDLYSEREPSYNFLRMSRLIRERFHISDDFVNTPEIQQVAKRQFKYYLNSSSYHSLKDALDIKKVFNISDEFVGNLEFKQIATEDISEEVAYNGRSNRIEDKISYVLMIKNGFKLSDEVFQASIIKGVIKVISSGRIEYVLELKEAFNIPDDFKTSLEVQRAAKEGMFNSLLSDGNIDKALKIKEVFKISNNEIKELYINAFFKLKETKNVDYFLSFASNFGFSPSDLWNDERAQEPRQFLEELTEGNEEVRDRYFSTFSGLEHIYSNLGQRDKILKILSENEFLRVELRENIQRGMRLILKYPEFDKTAKRGIKELFKDDSEIEEEDKEGLEYRLAMQEKLLPYRRNKEILETVEGNGINPREWLNYEEQSFITLGEEEEKSLGEVIRFPVERLQESFSHYTNVIKAQLGLYLHEYPEIKELTIKSDVSELVAQKEKMEVLEKQTREGGSTKKADGIKKGIENLELRIANPKEIKLTDRLNGELSRLSLMGKQLNDLQNQYLEQEEKLNNKGINIKERRQIKSDLTQIEHELRKKVDVLSRFSENLLGNMKEIVLSSVKTDKSHLFNKDRAEVFVREIETSIYEEVDHVQSDMRSLKSFFVKQEKDEFKGNLIRTYVHSRNPHTGLYLGNYTDCCIRIDSDYHGSESPIVDYLTDLGMHNVVMTDEDSSKPIVSAWCWLGVDPNTDEIALVIDNIEANTGYTGKYKQQLTKELKKYLEKMAKKLKLPITQGSHNNDITVTDYSEKYVKLGGYNRKSGYYLEAEPEDE